MTQKNRKNTNLSFPELLEYRIAPTGLSVSVSISAPAINSGASVSLNVASGNGVPTVGVGADWTLVGVDPGLGARF